MSIRQEVPPAGKGAPDPWPEANELVDKALANRDEWFALDIPESIKASAVHQHIRSAVLRRLDYTIRTRDGVVYLQIGDTA